MLSSMYKMMSVSANNIKMFTNLYPVSSIRDIGKQCRPKLDAAERLILVYSALNTGIQPDFIGGFRLLQYSSSGV